MGYGRLGKVLIPNQNVRAGRRRCHLGLRHDLLRESRRCADVVQDGAGAHGFGLVCGLFDWQQVRYDGGHLSVE